MEEQEVRSPSPNIILRCENDFLSSQKSALDSSSDDEEIAQVRKVPDVRKDDLASRRAYRGPVTPKVHQFVPPPVCSSKDRERLEGIRRASQQTLEEKEIRSAAACLCEAVFILFSYSHQNIYPSLYYFFCLDVVVTPDWRVCFTLTCAVWLDSEKEAIPDIITRKDNPFLNPASRRETEDEEEEGDEERVNVLPNKQKDDLAQRRAQSRPLPHRDGPMSFVSASMSQADMQKWERLKITEPRCPTDTLCFSAHVAVWKVCLFVNDCAECVCQCFQV